MPGVARNRIVDTPFAVVDLETTGLYAGGDRVVEVAVREFPPHLCLMYMRPLLGLGSRCSLSDACREHVIEHKHCHEAAVDAMAASRLWQYYTVVLGQEDVNTFADLAARKAYKFCESFANDMIGSQESRRLSSGAKLKPRCGERRTATALPQIARYELVGEYWDSLTAALSDLAVTPDELRHLRGKQLSLSLTEDELRWLHARAFAGILADMCQDKAVTVDEVWALSNVTSALRTLGWAPGDMATELAAPGDVVF